MSADPLSASRESLRGKRCLVAGGTGFLGGRLVERLVAECGADVRVLVRNFAHAARIARFPVEMVPGDLGVAADVARAAAGRELLFNCAYGNHWDPAVQRRVNVDGTRHLIEAVLREGCGRLVHLSTLAVYGDTPDGDLDERAPRRAAGDAYAETKLEGEALALAAAERGAPITVLQPTIVYGPFAPGWTLRILGELQRGRVILVDGGAGLCNAVYVDDVVSAMLQAAVVPGAVGEAFLVSGAEPVAWREYYGAYERMLGEESHVLLSLAESEALFRERYGRRHLLRESLRIVQESPELRRRLRATPEAQAFLRAGRLVVPGALRRAVRRKLRGKTAAARAGGASAPAASAKPINLMAPPALRMHAARTRVRIDKARSLLGYRPAFDLAAGMQRTEAWARWARLVPAREGEP